MSLSPQLAVFAAAAVISAHGLAMLIVFGLAGHAKAYTRNRLAPRIRNLASAVLTVRETIAPWQFVAGALDGIFDRSVDLFLNCAVFRESTGHCWTFGKTLLRQL
jgi:hypothetical protein